MPGRRARLAWERHFTAEEYTRLSWGHIPQEMEDRWFVFMEPDEDGDHLYFHRSWTGYCIYQVRLAPDGDGYGVRAVYVNRDPDQYRSQSEASDLALLVELLIDGLLLRQGPRLGPDDLLRHLRNVHTAPRE